MSEHKWRRSGNDLIINGTFKTGNENGLVFVYAKVSFFKKLKNWYNWKFLGGPKIIYIYTDKNTWVFW